MPKMKISGMRASLTAPQIGKHQRRGDKRAKDVDRLAADAIGQRREKRDRRQSDEIGQDSYPKHRAAVDFDGVHRV